ncbi:MAG: FadR family transcriptional regulator [Planctomycetota bacterium]|jgi:GntR family transcriptional repressor for pyruvate dehydrogenase complex|nr:FadR family transcriptional regulator [Planctomycetota bacterium]
MTGSGVELLSQGIANKLKLRIVEGGWRVNEQLPNEQSLAEQLKVSRTTIREAVKILVSKNILRIERGRGTFVVGTPGLADDPLGLEFVPEGTLIRHLCEYRLLLEPCASRLAAERATGKQLEEMGRIVGAMAALERDYSATGESGRDRVLDRFAGLDAKFHTLLYRMTQNMVFQRLSPIANDTVIANYTTGLYRRRGQKLRFHDTHRALFLAIQARDPELAFRLTREQLETMGEELIRETSPAGRGGKPAPAGELQKKPGTGPGTGNRANAQGSVHRDKRREIKAENG